MARARNTASLDFSTKLTLNEAEIRALDALVGYGDDAFIKHFKENLGASYLRDHEAGLRSVFAAVRRDVLPALHDIDEARRDLMKAAEKRHQTKDVRDADWTCPICDGGPGNDNSCLCPTEVKW